MARPDKAAAVAELTEKFQSSSAAVLTEYRGLTVAQLTKLRQTISEHATYAVVKNTLTDIAAREAGVTAFDGQLTGPSAIAFVTGDPVETARSMRDFARDNPALVIRGGLLEGRALSADEVRQLADLEPREVLLAKLAGAMKASMSGAAALFVAPLAQTARVVDALRQKIEQDPAQSAAQESAPAEPAADAAPESAGEPAAEPATQG
jgi:large subunit ribosomal protein L10